MEGQEALRTEPHCQIWMQMKMGLLDYNLTDVSFLDFRLSEKNEHFIVSGFLFGFVFKYNMERKSQPELNRRET